MAQEMGLGEDCGAGAFWDGPGNFQKLALAFSKIKKPCLQNGKQGHILIKLQR